MRLKYQKMYEQQINYKLNEQLCKLQIIINKVKTEWNWKPISHIPKEILALDCYNEKVKTSPSSQRPVIEETS